MKPIPVMIRTAVAGHFTLVLAAALSVSAAGQTVSLHSVMVAPDGTVTVTYSKDFATCAHLMTASNVLVHAQNIFCTPGTNVMVTAQPSQFNANFAVGVQVKLCHGNNYGICSGLVPVTANTLTGRPATISLAAGGDQILVLAAGTSHAGRSYLLAGSVTGTSPGIPIAGFVIPLNPDPYFDYTVSFPNTFPLSNSLGTLGSGGNAIATLSLPPGLPPSLSGVTAHHAYAVVNGTGTLVLASNATPVSLVP